MSAAPFFERTLTAVFHRRGVLSKSAGNQRPSYRGQFNLAHASVLGPVLARTSPFLDQSIDRHTDGSGVSQTFGPMVFTGRRSFMKERFEDAEIRVRPACLPNALRRARDERFEKAFMKTSQT